jgi:hypothetical protein
MSSSMGFGWHPIYEMENNPFMFETTNHFSIWGHVQWLHVLACYRGYRTAITTEGCISGWSQSGNLSINQPDKVIWLVVSTILKNISQWEGLSHILWKIKNVPNHQPVIIIYSTLITSDKAQAIAPTIWSPAKGPVQEPGVPGDKGFPKRAKLWWFDGDLTGIYMAIYDLLWFMVDFTTEHEFHQRKWWIWHIYADHVELGSEKNGDVNNQNFGLDRPKHVWFHQVTKNGDLVTKKFYIFIYQVVPSTRRGGSFENRTWL